MPDLPPYVPRDQAEELERAVLTGGLVVVEGDSATGKTRMAFEAMQNVCGQRWLIVPGRPSGLRQLAGYATELRPAVVWLDDLEEYLANGLDDQVLDAFCPIGQADTVLLATLRSEQRSLFTGGETSSEMTWAARRVLRRATFVQISKHLSAGEATRAREKASDPRIAAALERVGLEGFAENLAAGPAALEYWDAGRNGVNRVGCAIVDAAIDARRAGFASGVTDVQLRRLSPYYLDPQWRPRLEESDFQEGLRWATAPIRGASACVNPLGDGRYQVFDYLLDRAIRRSEKPAIPEEVWELLLSYVSPDDVMAFAEYSYYCDRLDLSERAFRRRLASEPGDTRAIYNLAVVLNTSGRRQAATELWRSAGELGDVTAMAMVAAALIAEEHHARSGQGVPVGGARTDMRTERLVLHDRRGLGAIAGIAVHLAAVGDTDGATDWWRRAQTTWAQLSSSPEPSSSERFIPAHVTHGWHVAAESGDITAMANIAALFIDQGRVREADGWWRRAERAWRQSSSTRVRSNLPDDQLDDSSPAKRLTDEAEQWLRRAADSGDAGAMAKLAARLVERGDADGAVYWWSRSDASRTAIQRSTGHHEGTPTLTAPGKTRYELQAEAEKGDPKAMVNLAALLFDQGRKSEADKWSRRAEMTWSHDRLPAASAGLSRDRPSKWLLRRRAQNGDADAMANLAAFLTEQGSAHEAAEWWTRSEAARRRR